MAVKSARVVVPVTPKVPPTVVLPDAERVVKAPVEAEFDPIAVPSMSPALISTVDNVEVPVAVKSASVVVPVTPKVPPTVVLPEAERVVKAPVEAEFEPIAVPSMSPALISTVDKVEVPVAERVVKAPVEADVAPIAVPSMLPALISTVDNVEVPLVTLKSAPTERS